MNPSWDSKKALHPVFWRLRQGACCILVVAWTVGLLWIETQIPLPFDPAESTFPPPAHTQIHLGERWLNHGLHLGLFVLLYQLVWIPGARWLVGLLWQPQWGARMGIQE